MLNTIKHKFQFHKGTIRTLGRIDFASRSLIFQFHKGTIRTEEDNARANIASNFNSIKVRLERSSGVSFFDVESISIP